MYFSVIDIGVVMLALISSISIILLTARANRQLIRQNRRLREVNKRQQDQCRNYHSPRPF
jgi:hypothetical protein